MILNPKLSRTIVPLLARRATLAAALLAVAPLSALALGPQGAKASKSPAEEGRPEPANRAGFALEIKVVRLSDRGDGMATRFASEPYANSPKPPTVLRRTTVNVQDGVPAFLPQAGGVGTPGATFGIGGEEGARDMLVSFGGTPTESPHNYLTAYRPFRPYEWLRIPILDEMGRYSGWQMLIHVVPLSDAPAVPPLNPRTQGSKPRRKDAVPVAPAQIVLRCKIVEEQRERFMAKKIKARYGDLSFAVAKEIRLPNDARVVTAPVVRTLSGQEASVGAKLDGVEHKVRMLAKLGKDGRYTLQLAFTHLKGNTWRVTHSSALYVSPGEYLWFGVPKPSGTGYAYQLVVQVSPS